MTSNIKLIFMGIPGFSVPSLEAIAKNFEVLSVYTQPPRNSGRGLQKRVSPIHSYAEKNGLPVKTPRDFSDSVTVDEVIKQKADFIIGLKKSLQQNYYIQTVAKQKKIPIYGVKSGSIYQVTKLIQFIMS